MYTLYGTGIGQLMAAGLPVADVKYMIVREHRANDRDYPKLRVRMTPLALQMIPAPLAQPVFMDGSGARYNIIGELIAQADGGYLAELTSLPH